MAKFIKRSTSKIIVCDYCRKNKCRWTKNDSGNPPEKCKKVSSIKIADDYVGKEEFNRRVEIAKRLASYNPNEEMWFLDPTVKDPLTGYELKKTIEDEVNEWSEENELKLSDLVEYEEKGFEKFEDD